MIKNYFKIAIRNFWRHKLFTFINIIGLSIGISAALVIYLIVHFDFTFDKFHPDGDRIYRVVTNSTFEGDANYNSGVCGPLGDAVKNEASGVQTSAPFYTSNVDVQVDNGQKKPAKFKDQSGVIIADGRYFTMFQYKWLDGSPKTALNAPNKVVLTASRAKKYFPGLSYDQMMGKVINYNDSVKIAVGGIVQDFTQNTDLTFNEFISYLTPNIDQYLTRGTKEWGGTSSASQLYVKLMPGVEPSNVEKQLYKIFRKHYPEKAESKGNTQNFGLQPLSDLHFNTHYYAYDNAVVSINTLYGLMVIGAFLLLLGCINFINLTTAHASQRAKEIGIRKTMGSTRSQLVSQYLSETFLVTLIAVIIAACLAPVILKQFTDFIPKGITLGLFDHPGIILFLFVLAVVVSLLSGFYPAIVLSGYKPVLALKNQANDGSSQTRNARLRKTLTVTQFVIAQFFIMATILVSKQVNFAINKDLGFKKDAIIYINTPWKNNTDSKKQFLFNKLSAIPQIALLGRGGDVPSSNGWNSSEVTYKDGKKEIKVDLQMKSGDENYIKIYNIKLLAGRNITINDTSKAMLINMNYARILGFKTPQQALNKFISFGDKDNREIVGVIADFYQGSLHSPIKPLAIQPDPKYNFGTFHIALKPETAGGNEWKTGIASMQSAWKQVYPDDDFDYHFFDKPVAHASKVEECCSLS